MAAKRRCTLAVAAVVLLLCLSSAVAAKSPDAEAAVVPPKASDKALETPAAAISNPQHAPQFPDESSKGQGSTPPQQQHDKQPQQQLPAATPTPAAAPVKQAPAQEAPKPAEAKPSTPVQDAPKAAEQPAPKQPAASTPAPKQDVISTPAPKQEASTPAPKADPSTPAPKQDAPKPTAGDAPKPAAPITNFKQEVKEEEKDKKEEKEDPCKRVPGCMECTPYDPKSPMMMGFSARKLQQKDPDWGMEALSSLKDAGSMKQSTGQTQKGKRDRTNMDFLDMDVHSAYDAKDLPMCTKCNSTAGYVNYSRGRCACAAGYGDTSPTGTCNRCPNGYFSQGGFRAVCVECEGVAFSNVDHTACVCASGWYGVTSYATKQASCNMCPGSRPVSAEGARSASDCKACPTGEAPNEIFSECVDPSKIPPPEPVTAPTQEEEPSTPAPPPLFNSSTFEHTREEWTMHTRNTQNHTHPLTDFFGSLMDSVVMGKNLTPTAKTPGELFYQVVTKPAATASAPKMPTLPNIDMQNPTQIGAGIGAALAAVPGVLGGAVANGGKISDVVDTVRKAVEDGSKAAGSDMAASGSGWDSFLKGLTATAPKDSSGKSEVADLAKSLGDLFGAAGKVATEVAEKSDNSLVKSIGGLLSAAKKGETIEGPLSTEAALIAAPEPAPKAGAPADNGWSSMLSGLLSGNAAAPAAPATPAAEAAPGNDWTKMFSGFSKGTAGAAPTPAAPATGSASNAVQQLLSGLQGAAAAAPAGSTADSTTDFTKMLAALTAPSAKVANPNPHSITAAGQHYVAPEKQAAGASTDAASAASNLLSALAKYSTNKAPAAGASRAADAQKVVSGSQPAGDLGSIIGGLFKKPSGTFSFATGNGANKLGAKIQQVAQQASGPAAGFISVPSAPPKGSAAIKSGKFGFGKAKAMKHGAKAKAQ